MIIEQREYINPHVCNDNASSDGIIDCVELMRFIIFDKIDFKLCFNKQNCMCDVKHSIEFGNI